MTSFATPPRHLPERIVFAAMLASVLLAARAHAGEIVGAPINLSAFAHEALIPGDTLFDRTNTTPGALSNPKERAIIFHQPDKGQNLSGKVEHPSTPAKLKRPSNAE